jgi:hypothetical protein
LGDVTKTLLRGKFVALNIYVSKDEKFEISNKPPFQESKATKTQAIRRKKIIMVRPEINELKSKSIRENHLIKRWKERLER